MCLLLLAAGHETTANLIGNGTLALFEHPDQLDWLTRHPDLCPQAVEELLRYDSPVQVASRVALDDLVLGGVKVRKGQQALVVLGAANRDPARYPDPDRLDLTRTGPPHLAFGNGPHFCVGAGLARLEAQETFNRLAQSALRPRAGSWSHCREPSRTFRRLRSLRIGGSQPLIHRTRSTPCRFRRRARTAGSPRRPTTPSARRSPWRTCAPRRTSRGACDPRPRA